jgi:hypothetical protein
MLFPANDTAWFANWKNPLGAVGKSIGAPPGVADTAKVELDVPRALFILSAINTIPLGLVKK